MRRAIRIVSHPYHPGKTAAGVAQRSTAIFSRPHVPRFFHGAAVLAFRPACASCLPENFLGSDELKNPREHFNLFARRSVFEYWHIGETPVRIRNWISPNWSGANKCAACSGKIFIGFGIVSQIEPLRWLAREGTARNASGHQNLHRGAQGTGAFVQQNALSLLNSPTTPAGLRPVRRFRRLPFQSLRLKTRCLSPERIHGG